MKKYFLVTVITLLTFFNMFSQSDSITIEGVMIEENGKPLSGGIYIYRGNNNTYYRYLRILENGKYTVKVQKGEKVKFYANGNLYGYYFFNYEYIANEDNIVYSTPFKQYKKIVNDGISKTKGYAKVGNAKYIQQYNYYYNFKMIYGIPVNSVNIYYSYYNNYDITNYNISVTDIVYDKDSNYFLLQRNYNTKKTNFLFTTSFSFQNPNKLPLLQNKYSQGYNQIFDNNSVYSFGADTVLLSQSDKYNQYDYFVQGYTFSNSLSFSEKFRNSILKILFSNNSTQGIVKSSSKIQNNFSFFIEEIKLRRLKFAFDFNFINNISSFPETDANYARIMHSVSTTPINFNNKLDTSVAYSSNAINPYLLENKNLDFSRYNLVNGSFSSLLDLNHFDFLLKTGFDFNNELITGGLKQNDILPDYYFRREILQNHYFADFDMIYSNYWGFFDNFELKLAYKFDYLNVNNDYNNFNFSNLTFPSANRITNEITLKNSYKLNKNKFDYSEILIDANLSLYNSSTLKSKLYYLSPSFLLNVKLDEFRFAANYTSFYKEYPIYLNKLTFNTLNYRSEDFIFFKEINYPKINENIVPEKNNNYTFNIGYYGYVATFNLTYTLNKHKNAIYPVLSNEYQLNNIADFTSQNLSFLALVNITRYYSKFGWNFSTSISFPKSNVDKIYLTNERIPFTGFQDISMNLVEGKPVGVLYGTGYEHNENGSKIIGTDGFPILNDSIIYLGDPNPKYIFNFNNNLKFDRLSLSINLEYKHGGVVWNGTQNYLNYYGTSKQSAERRYETNYIYQGVNQNGETNNIPVIVNEYFYQKNGIPPAEDGIQDASWFRLKEISLKFELPNIWFKRGYNSNNKNEISIWAQNLLIYTPYSGVDPQTALFSYYLNQGLDLFNMPACRSYGFTLNFYF